MNSNKRFPAKSSDHPTSMADRDKLKLEQRPRRKPLSRIMDKVKSFSLFHCIRFDAEFDWLELPHDVLSLIIDKVITFSLSDYIRFAAVCSNWRRFCLENYEHIKIPNTTPILVKLPLNNDRSTESFYSLYERKDYYFQLPVPIYTDCRGSNFNFGWIITVTDKDILGVDYFVRLSNPFRSVNNEIQIPSARMYWDKHDHGKGGATLSIKKAVLSSSPSSNPKHFILMAIYYDNTMGFYKSGDKAWTIIKPELISNCQDVVYYKGRFFVNTYDGSVLVLDSRTLNSDEPKFDVLTGKPPVHREHDDDIKGAHFVESASGDLLLVYRLYLNYKTTVDFQVFKLVQFTKWVEVNTLEGHILFLSKNGSVSVSAADLPGSKPNCIYFAGLQIVSGRLSFDQCLEGGYHMGIFNLEDRSFEPNYLMKSRDSMIALNWIQPTL